MALERGAARQVHDERELAAAVALYFAYPDLRRAAGSAAYSLVTDNRGALERTLALIHGVVRRAQFVLGAPKPAEVSAEPVDR